MSDKLNTHTHAHTEGVLQVEESLDEESES